MAVAVITRSLFTLCVIVVVVDDAFHLHDFFTLFYFILEIKI